MPQQRMDADIAAQTHQMQFAVIFEGMIHCGVECFVFKKIALDNRMCDPHGTLINHPSSANVLVPHFTVAHCSRRKPHIFAVGADQAVWVVGHQLCIHWRLGLFNRIISVLFGTGIIAPTVTNNHHTRPRSQCSVLFRHIPINLS